MGMENLKYEAKLHLVKKHIGECQGKNAKRRLELWEKLKPLISNPTDKELIENVLVNKKLLRRHY